MDGNSCKKLLLILKTLRFLRNPIYYGITVIKFLSSFNIFSFPKPANSKGKVRNKLSLKLISFTDYLYSKKFEGN